MSQRNDSLLETSTLGSHDGNDYYHHTSIHTAPRILEATAIDAQRNSVEHSSNSPQMVPPGKSLHDAESQLTTLYRPTRSWRSLINRLSAFDIRPKLPFWVSRFLGYRPDGIRRPVWALRWLETLHVPLVVEEYMAACFSAVFALICVIMVNTMTSFSSLPIPLSLGFSGAMAIVLYATPLSPAASPRSVVLSHLFASVLATFISTVFLDDRKMSSIVIRNEMTVNKVWIWACVAVMLTLVFEVLAKAIHPPAGATALIGTITPGFVKIGWLYVAFVMVTVCLMLGVAIVFGNLGRRVYPLYWWTPPMDPHLQPASREATKKPCS